MRNSPTIQGFRTVFRLPSLWLAEIAWRWSFGIGALLLVLLAGFEFLGSVPLSKAGRALASAKNPLLAALAVADALQGSGGRLLLLAAVLLVGLPTLWIFAAALGRTATANALVAKGESDRSRSGFGAELGLSFLRTALALAALAAFIGSALLAYRTAGPTNEALVAFLCIAAAVACVWGMLNWILVLAAIFPALSGSHTVGAIATAMRLFRRRVGQFFATTTWFGLAHVAVFIVALFVAAHPAAMLGASPRRAAALLIAIAFGYAATIDFLCIARLAAYVAIAEDDRGAADAIEPAPIIDAPSAVPLG